MSSKRPGMSQMGCYRSWQCHIPARKIGIHKKGRTDSRSLKAASRIGISYLQQTSRTIFDNSRIIIPSSQIFHTTLFSNITTLQTAQCLHLFCRIMMKLLSSLTRSPISSNNLLARCWQRPLPLLHILIHHPLISLRSVIHWKSRSQLKWMDTFSPTGLSRQPKTGKSLSLQASRASHVFTFH